MELLDSGRSDHAAITIAGGGPSITYDGLKRQIESLVQQLNNLGLGRGDRIAMALPNGIELIASFLAAGQAGTAAPLNPGYKYDEFKFYLEDTRAKALILPPGELEEARRAAGNDVLIIEASMDSGGVVSYSSKGKAGASRSAEPVSDDDIALMLHTSGTTSRPKRVPLAHKNLMASAHNVANWYGLTQDDVALCVMPLFHVHGLVASTLATLTTGGTVAVVPRFNALSFWPAVKEQRATWYSAVPTIHQLLLARSKAGAPRPQGSESLRFIRSCSAALPPQTMADVEERFGAPILEAYGMTEAAHQMASNPLPPRERKPGSVGVGTQVQIAILDDQGNLLQTGQHGEVSIKGPNVFSGYEDNPEANAKSFSNGWFRTGDFGFLDDQGYLVLLSRIKELIIRGGENISPREIDEVLLKHPAVSEAVSFGVPSKMYGEEVAAAVVLKAESTEAELIGYCKTMMADFKVPKVVYIVNEIPRTATGKVQRRIVAAEIGKVEGK